MRFLKIFKYCFLLAGMLLLSNRVTAQKKEINGLVINAVSKDTLVAAIVFNLNSVDGTVTDEKGMFSLPVAVNDTLMFDFLGYQTIKIKVTGDLLKVDGLTVELYEKPEELDSVTLKNHGLVGVLEIDIKQVPMDRFNRIHIRGLKQTYEVGQLQPRSYTSFDFLIGSPAWRIVVLDFKMPPPLFCSDVVNQLESFFTFSFLEYLNQFVQVMPINDTCIIKIKQGCQGRIFYNVLF